MIASPTSWTCRDEVVDREIDAEARDRLELVERAARVTEAAPAHLPDRNAAGRHDRADRDRRLVADAAGRVLVHDLAAERGAEIERPAAADHRVGQRVRLRRRHAAEVDGHAERGQLVVGDLAARVAEDQLRDLLGRELLPVPLPLDQLRGVDHGWRIGVPGIPRPGALPPSQAFTVAPTSPNSPCVHRALRVPSRRIDEQERMLARVIRRRRRRIAAVVGRDDQQVARPQRLEDVLEPAVEVLQAAVEVDRVVAVPPEHVRLDEVREDEAAVDRLQQLDGLVDPVDVRLRRERLVDVAAGVDVADLADGMHLVPGVSDQREVVGPARLEREVVAVRRPLVAAGRAGERPRDHATDRVLAGEDLARDPAPLVELLERDRLLVRRDLEDGVGRRVDDPLARLLMLLAELLDDVGARRRLVPEHAAARLVHERVDHVVREPVRVRRHRGRRDDAHQLPVARRRVLALRPFEQPPGDRRRARLGRAALQLHHVPEAESLERGQVETTDGAGHVAERVRPLIAELGRIWQLSRTDGIEHDYAGPRHLAIVRRVWTLSSA